MTCETIDDTDDSLQLTLEDNIDVKFSTFAKVNLRLSRQATTDLVPSRVISAAQYERLSHDVQSNRPHYYTLKATYRRRSIQDYVMTSVPLCLVVQAQFQYRLSLFINENGYATSIYLTTGNSTCSKTSLSTTTINKIDYPYKVDIRMELSETGPQPDTQHFLEKLRREKEAKQNAEQNDNRPFFLKYWKYIIPVVVIVLLQGVFSDNGGQQGGGGGGQR
ncbi:unnamed protein product [Didymodactylos carnosus]|uniref:ER membrane protein complex subunit 10 n=1 Tax=Didymodactylos carnosus TaxID=1234261 RepID=A0A814C3L7_9BILA|nr:unnamed protein product [Didymodactylos carnosus]CAF0936362.1 unnamed protein product [Didymodactylos carnosus]CAF3586865.1 unnamed protein product [Didymodactylos carnosus]CAF3713497.1 unnamed protein product [Didymodactylos carnosus]